MDTWSATVALYICLPLIGLCAIWCWVEGRRSNPPVIKYRDINAPGAFMVGKDLK